MAMTVPSPASVVLPLARTNDSDDIRWALETASAMWSRGDGREALRWLRRAAESAAEEGLDTRAVELAKSAAELRGHIDLPPSIVPSPPPKPPRVEREASLPANDDAVATEHPSAPALDDAAEQLTGESWPPRRFMRTEPGISDVPPPPNFVPDAPTGQQVAASPDPPGAADADEPEIGSFVSHQAIRVAITTSPTQPGILTARILRPGQPVPRGAREALFVALEPGIELYLED
jgi:hypothetical protein